MRFQSPLTVKCSKETTPLFQEKKECEPNQEGGVEVSTDPTAGGQLGFLVPSLDPLSASGSSTVESGNEASCLLATNELQDSGEPAKLDRLSFLICRSSDSCHDNVRTSPALTPWKAGLCQPYLPLPDLQPLLFPAPGCRLPTIHL